MFHKNVLNPSAVFLPNKFPNHRRTQSSSARFALVPSGGQSTSKKSPTPLFDLIAIAASRGGSRSCARSARPVDAQGPHGMELGCLRIHHQRGFARHQHSHRVFVPPLGPAPIVVQVSGEPLRSIVGGPRFPREWAMPSALNPVASNIWPLLHHLNVHVVTITFQPTLPKPFVLFARVLSMSATTWTSSKRLQSVMTSPLVPPRRPPASACGATPASCLT
jgi:hypothetical protein